MKAFNVTFFLLLLILLINCKNVSKPEKISNLGMLGSKADGSSVEFTTWVRSVAGDEKLGLELTTSESANTYPMAIIALKDGQKNPGKEKQLCIRGLLLKRDEVGGGTLYRITDAEVIECY